MLAAITRSAVAPVSMRCHTTGASSSTCGPRRPLPPFRVIHWRRASRAWAPDDLSAFRAGVTLPLVRPSYTIDGAAKLLTDGTSNAEGFEHRHDW